MDRADAEGLRTDTQIQPVSTALISIFKERGNPFNTQSPLFRQLRAEVDHAAHV